MIFEDFWPGTAAMIHDRYRLSALYRQILTIWMMRNARIWVVVAHIWAEVIGEFWNSGFYWLQVSCAFRIFNIGTICWSRALTHKDTAAAYRIYWLCKQFYQKPDFLPFKNNISCHFCWFHFRETNFIPRVPSKFHSTEYEASFVYLDSVYHKMNKTKYGNSKSGLIIDSTSGTQNQWNQSVFRLSEIINKSEE